jgi:hypothetical protein
MKHIKLYNLFKKFESSESSDSNLARRKTYDLCNEYLKGNYVVIKNEVYSDDILTLKLDLDYIPIKFGEVRTIFINCTEIKSLKNSPRVVTYALNLQSCFSLKSFEGASEYVGAFIHLGSVEIDNFNGLPKPLKDKYYLTLSFDNKLRNVLPLFLNSKVEGGRINTGYIEIDSDAIELIDLFNDYDPLRGDGIVLNRLNEFLNSIGKDSVDKVDGYEILD